MYVSLRAGTGGIRAENESEGAAHGGPKSCRSRRNFSDDGSIWRRRTGDAVESRISSGESGADRIRRVRCLSHSGSDAARWRCRLSYVQEASANYEVRFDSRRIAGRLYAVPVTGMLQEVFR